MFISIIYWFAIALLALATANMIIMNQKTVDSMKKEGKDPRIVHPEYSIRGVSQSILILNWLIAAAVGHYIYV